MSEGATMSAPARACESASSASSSSVGSLATSPFSITPQWPWLVYSHRQTSVITTRFSFARANRFDGALHRAGRRPGLGAALIFVLGDAEQNDRRECPALRLRGTPRQTCPSDCWATPGIEAISIAHAAARAHKHRIDEAVRREARFAHHAADRFAAPQPPRALDRKTHPALALEPVLA